MAPASQSQSVKQLAYAAVAIATVALGASLYAQLAPAEPAPAPALACSCDDGEIGAELQRLRADVATLRGRVQRLRDEGERSERPAASAAPAASPPDEADEDEERIHPRFVSFELPNPHLTVVQRPNGTLSVMSSDGELSGTQVTVVGITEDGERHRVAVLVP